MKTLTCHHLLQEASVVFLTPSCHQDRQHSLLFGGEHAKFDLVFTVLRISSFYDLAYPKLKSYDRFIPPAIPGLGLLLYLSFTSRGQYSIIMPPATFMKAIPGHQLLDRVAVP